uniref:Putative TRAP transporter DctQ-like membrane protein n=1 Tax=uncultured bacterium 888 TaxID=548896 RepID=B8R8R3_9BACT|nr:putative TRAP transporter DctQ-like membrane protein [uncultured bacterium 888]
MYRKIVSGYAQLLRWLLAIAVGVLTIPVSLQIFSRYTDLIPSYIWTEEMARFLFVWMIMIGAMLGIHEGRHFEVDVWPKLAPRPQAALRLASNLAVLVFALVFVWAGWYFTRFAWNRISELAELPLWLIHMAWPLAGATWLVFTGEQIWDNLRTLVTGRVPIEMDEAPDAGSSGGSAV